MSDSLRVDSGRCAPRATPGGTGVTARRRSFEERDATIQEVFQAVLRSTGELARARSMAESRYAPGQMFDADRNRPRTDAANDGADTHTRNVESPVAAGRELEDPMREPAANSVPEANTNPRPVLISPSPSEAASHRDGGPMTLSSLPGHRTLNHTAHALTAAEPAGKTGQGADPRSERAQSAALPGGNAAMAFRSAQVVPSGSGPIGEPMTNPARQIGEILATARGGEVGDGSPPASRAQDPATRTPHSSARAEPRSDARAENDAEASPFERLVRSMRVQVGEKFSTARLRLHPPELGRLQVDVRVEGARAEVDVRTETQAAQELVAGRAEELRMALKQQGIDVQRIEVMVEERPGAARFRGERPRTGRDGHGFAGNAATQAHPTARTARGGRGSGLDVRV